MMRWLFKTILFLPLTLQAQEVTYHEDIAPIIDAHCTVCHSPGNIGPMPLTNYEEVSSYATMIEYVTGINYMPPGQADYGYAAYERENYLSEHEKDLIKEWVSAGMPERDHNTTPVKADNSRKSIDDTAVLACNDTVYIGMNQSFEQYGIYYDQFHVFVIPNDTGEDILVKGMEFVPGNRKIVRSALVSMDTTNRSDSLENWDPRYGYNQFAGAGFAATEPAWMFWDPEQTRYSLPDGYFRRLPANGRLMFHMHYGPTPKEQTDSSGLVLYTLDHVPPGSRLVRSEVLLDTQHITNQPFEIAPGQLNRFHARRTLDKDMELLSILPQGQLILRSWEVFARHPDSGEVVTLIRIPDWNMHWRKRYRFEEPVMLKKGTEIHAIATYDNRVENLYNPANPPTTIKYGFGMFEELFRVIAEVVQ